MQVESKIMEQVKSVLSGFGNKYINSNGSLKRNTVIEDLDHYDKDLMTALLANPQIHDQYTEKVANTEVFKLNQFIDVFEYKEFWEDSFTKYSKVAANQFLQNEMTAVLGYEPHTRRPIKRRRELPERDVHPHYRHWVRWN